MQVIKSNWKSNWVFIFSFLNITLSNRTRYKLCPLFSVCSTKPSDFQSRHIQFTGEKKNLNSHQQTKSSFPIVLPLNFSISTVLKNLRYSQITRIVLQNTFTQFTESQKKFFKSRILQNLFFLNYKLQRMLPQFKI